MPKIPSRKFKNMFNRMMKARDDLDIALMDYGTNKPQAKACERLYVARCDKIFKYVATLEEKLKNDNQGINQETPRG